ncbi:hypothetical protein EDC04DRAFT_1510183 [Pisolithus marmoratus]|nr:hypothetical protein EDC04DRAFT_1510183 [Pisolithus marmoratus]
MGIYLWLLGAALSSIHRSISSCHGCFPFLEALVCSVTNIATTPTPSASTRVYNDTMTSLESSRLIRRHGAGDIHGSSSSRSSSLVKNIVSAVRDATVTRSVSSSSERIGTLSSDRVLAWCIYI